MSRDPKRQVYGEYKVPKQHQHHGIPAPTKDIDSIHRTLEHMRENMEQMLDQRGDLKDSSATVADLTQLYQKICDKIDNSVDQPFIDYKLTAATNTINFPNLQGIADGGYRIEINFYDNQAVAGGHACYINQDTTASNYRYQHHYVSGATHSVNQAQGAYCGWTNTSGQVTWRLDVDLCQHPGNDNWYVSIDSYIGTDALGGGTPQGPSMNTHRVAYMNTVTDLSHIQLVGTQNFYRNNCRVRVWRKG